MKVDHSRVQHGVGQGSFHSATVQAVDDKGVIHRFDYVYDCGSGSPKVLGRCIDRIDLDQRADSKGQVVLDALVLSHYDKDHLSGARLLASKCSVSRVYVPYLGPDELAFVIASQAGRLQKQDLRDLHAVANGSTTLFSVPMTQVRGGDRAGSDGETDHVIEPNDDGGREQSTGNDSGTPVTMRIIQRSTNTLPTGRMSHQDEILASPKLSASSLVWRLKFWNRGLSQVLVDILRDELRRCGFPVDRLNDPNGARGIIDWMDVPANRLRTVKAYRLAVQKHRPGWEKEADGSKLANFISLGLYAGPRVESEVKYFRAVGGSISNAAWGMPPICAFFDMCHRVGKAGWLGTGDAPLGEPGVWQDFENHFKGELGQVLTVLVPHHGSAPKNGPRFYNRLLNQEWGTVSVISCGRNNQYGHPKASVIKQILGAGGDLHVVNENCHLGLHEHLSFEM